MHIWEEGSICLVRLCLTFMSYKCKMFKRIFLNQNITNVRKMGDND